MVKANSVVVTAEIALLNIFLTMSFSSPLVMLGKILNF